MNISEYVDSINKRFKSGISKEHAYRGDLEVLIRSIVPGVDITNEPANVTDCGNPDYVISKGKIPIGYIEAKDIGRDLNNKQYQEQFERYKKALDNLIITDYINFQFYQNGKLCHEIKIAEISGKSIKPIPSNFQNFENLIRNFCTYISQTITSAKRLAEMMASKARLLENIILAAITSDELSQDNTSIKDQYESFKHILIHDLTPKSFSDIYAQTLAYGMFAARLHDTSLNDFTRHEAAELIPKTNPFLRKLFGYIAGPDIDERIKRTVDNLADVFRATNIEALLNSFKSASNGQDPIIHFYETFLSEYDPALRKSRGVWYTPQPVVNFIVRAVDDILKSEFNLKDGLADTSKIKIKVKDVTKATADLRSKTKAIEREEEVHRVQILDPAAGTGTFLAEIVKHIYKGFEGQQGIWCNYVENHLIPRLNGFEILMASYAMAHLKLDMLLNETGYKPQKEQRFKVYLTNSLEEHHPDTGTLFANWLSSEANEANHIKRDAPVMVVLGNPPYSVSSSNKSPWIQNLIADYKKDLNERKLNLDDDYIKFIRYGQHFIDKNGSGILAYISNNSFIDGITHRQMRRHLLASFDKIFILDLHGNAKKKEVCPDGSLDQNVFDIMQGVSINIFVKTGKKTKPELGKVFHIDLQGKKEFKYEALNKWIIGSIHWNNLDYSLPNSFFVPRNSLSESNYLKGFPINSLFVNSNSGIQTKNDRLTINMDIKVLEDVVKDFRDLPVEDLKSKYSLTDTSGWTARMAKEDIINNKGNYYKIYYRPFDIRFIYMTNKSGGFVGRPRLETMRHFFKGDNFGLITVRQQSTFSFQHILVSNTLMESGAISLQTKEWGYIFPLYTYPELNAQQTISANTDRTPNLNAEIIKQISDSLGLIFTSEKESTENTFAPIDILDYIYAVLYSPSYRNKYKEFLKIDFPHVSYPKDKKTFWRLVKLGGELRQIHLLESSLVEKRITTYPQAGNNNVDKSFFDNGKVWINDQQYFDGVPQVAWEFYIGGYQPAQKWLKDRKGRQLTFEDILHYQKIIVALTETDRIMKEIDRIDVE